MGEARRYLRNRSRDYNGVRKYPDQYLTPSKASRREAGVVVWVCLTTERSQVGLPPNDIKRKGAVHPSNLCGVPRGTRSNNPRSGFEPRHSTLSQSLRYWTTDASRVVDQDRDNTAKREASNGECPGECHAARRE
jgi:hypothetical protein